MSNIVEEIKQKTEEINRIKQEMVNDLKVRFKDIFLPFFEKWPQVKFVKWSQYTPHFNDGDPCVFGVNDMSGYIEGDDEYEGSISHYGVAHPEVNVFEVFTKNALDQVYQDFKHLESECRSIEESLFLDLFGDHAAVKVSREGIDVTEYIHD